MKIFCALEEEPVVGNRLWHNNIVDALRDLGHDVVVFQHSDLDAFYRHSNLDLPENRQWVERHRPRFEEALLSQIKRSHQQSPIDIFLSYFYNAHAQPDTIRAIHNCGIRTVNWYCNASYQFHLVRDIAPAYDLCLVPEKERLEDYRTVRANPVYCQEAANPVFYKAMKIPRDLNVVFVGQRYATREELCMAIHNAGLPVDVWGSGWSFSGPGPLWRRGLRSIQRSIQRWKNRSVLPAPRCHGFVNDQMMVQIYNRAKIALGFGVVSSSDYREKPRYQIRLRDFEAPMCGTFYLMEHQEEIREFFRIGEEIETFHNAEELIDKTRFYLANDSARERIRLAGYERARRDHTWQKRLTDCLGLAVNR